MRHWRGTKRRCRTCASYAYLHEIALHIRHGYKQEKVAQLLDRLDEQARRDEKLITRLDAELGKVRTSTFHYPKVSSQAILDGLRAVATRPAVWVADHERETLELDFAQPIAEGVAFGDVNANPDVLRALVQRVVEARQVVSGYVFAVLRLYQRGRRVEIVPVPCETP